MTPAAPCPIFPRYWQVSPEELDMILEVGRWWVESCFRARIELDDAHRRIRDLEARLSKKTGPSRIDFGLTNPFGLRGRGAKRDRR